MGYPLVNVYKKLWKITMLLMGKSTISTGPWLQYGKKNLNRTGVNGWLGAYSSAQGGDRDGGGRVDELKALGEEPLWGGAETWDIHHLPSGKLT